MASATVTCETDFLLQEICEKLRKMFESYHNEYESPYPKGFHDIKLELNNILNLCMLPERKIFFLQQFLNLLGRDEDFIKRYGLLKYEGKI